MNVRVVVTGEGADGEADFVHELDVPASPSSPGNTVHRLWSFDRAPEVPAPGVIDAVEGIFPAPGGVRFALVTYGPGEHAAAGDADAGSEVPEELRRVIPPGSGGLHTTTTVDLGFVVSGEIVLELPGGRERVLRPGDAFVQHGVEHAWRNRADVPCTVAMVLVGAPGQ